MHISYIISQKLLALVVLNIIFIRLNVFGQMSHCHRNHLEEPFRKISYDQKSNRLFIASKNTVLEISPTNFSTLSQQSLARLENGDCSSDEECATNGQSQDFGTQTMVVDADNNILIVCGTLKGGICYKLSLDGLGRVDAGRADNIVSLDENRRVHASLYPPLGGAAYEMLVGNSASSVANPGEEAYLKFVSSYRTNTFQPEFLIPYESQFLKKPTNIDVVGSFKYMGYTYFVINRPDTSIGEPKARLLRICDRNPTINSLVEVPLECASGVRFYQSAVASELTYLSDKMVKALDVVQNQVLFVLFSDSTSSAICLYPLEIIAKVFQRTVQDCFSGASPVEKGIFFLSKEPVSICQREAASSSDLSKYCGESTVNFPISGKSAVANADDGHSFYPMGVRATSFLVTSANNYNVAFLSTDRQSIVKVRMPATETPKSSLLLLPPPLLPSYYEWLLPIESQIREMVFDSGEGIYTLEDNNVCLVKRAICNHMNCDSCVIDPYCGWCLETKKCSQKTLCPNTKVWLSDSCPAMVEVIPKKIHFHEFVNTKIRMEAVNVHSDFKKAECSLSIVSETSQTLIYSSRAGIFDVTKSPSSLKVVCKEFADRPNQNHWNSRGYINMTLTLVLDGIDWVSDSVFLYNCSRFNRCSECASEVLGFPCKWCVSTHMCLLESYSSCSARFNTSTQSPTISKQDKCPSIDFLPGEPQVAASGTSFSYHISCRNVQEYYKTDLSCCFGNSSSVICSVAKFLPQEDDRCKIFCSAAELTYKAEKPFEVIQVNLVADSNSPSPKVIDNPNDVTLTLYKCRYMESSCGKCLLLNSSYGCVWCESGFCGTKEECSSKFLEKNSVCPNPTIASFQPAGGPLQGGTSVTIRGTNLGMKPEDVVVTLGTKECKVVPGSYVPAEKVVCNTSSVIRSEPVKLNVSISNLYSCVALKDFVFKNPELRGMNPTRGMRSGGTVVTIKGGDLDYGSRYHVSFGEKKANVLSRNSTHLLVVTGEYLRSMKVSVKVKVDGFEISKLPEQFEYLIDPDITGIRPKSTMLSGGRQIFVSGRSFDIISQAFLVIRFAYNNFSSPCVNKGSSSMICTTPDLRGYEDHFTDHSSNNYILTNFGFILDNISFPCDKDLMTYYGHPTIKKFAGVKVVKSIQEDVCIETEKSEWLSEFSSDIKVVVGEVNCTHNRLDAETTFICFKPVDCPVKDNNREQLVKVKINQYSEDVGQIKYPAPFKAGLVVGLVLGLLIPLIIGALIFVFFYLKRRGQAEIKRGQQPTASVNQPSPSTRNTNRYQDVPQASAEEAMPLTEYLDPNAYLDDAQYLEALLNRLDSQSVRSAAKQVYINRERLELGNQLGKGHFGTVYAATLRDTDLKNPLPVAVKTIDDTDLDQKVMEGFLKEGILMKNFNHPHVLSLLGLCLGYKKEPMVILPFMANGDLRSYVKDRKRSFTARQLLQLAQQVAEGMSYLASLNFIHRDLAARNCMIDDKSQVKVADFGLSHELLDREYYSSKNRRAKLPIKWMALESLENYVFTIKSDVWSFGVLLWELMTRGITPYPDVDVFETRNYLATGRRLYKPKFCPENVYAVMSDCWQESPERRPTFTDLVNRIELLLNPPKFVPSNPAEPSYINIPMQEQIQDYLKPISSPPEEDDGQSGRPPPRGREGSGDDDSISSNSVSSGSSAGGTRPPVARVNPSPLVKEASV